MLFPQPPAFWIALVCASVIATLSAIVGASIVLPLPADLPWWERAPRTFLARLVPVVIAFLIVHPVALITAITLSALQPMLPIRSFATIVLLSVIGPAAVAVWMNWFASPRRRPISRWAAGVVSALLFRFFGTLVYAIVALAIYLLPHDLLTTSTILLCGAMGIGFGAWGGGVWVARLIGLARPALPRAQHLVDWAAERVGARAEQTIEILWPSVRIDAVLFSRYLIVTDSAAELLSDDDLFGLAIRELAFFKQPRLAGTIRIADAAGVFVMLACTIIGATIGGNALLIGTAIGLCSAFGLRPFIRRAQLRADALAADAAIDSVSALRALERQFELNLQPMVAITNRSRDAHLYDRMSAAGIAPPYPRPRPPSKGRFAAAIAAALGTCVILSIAWLIFMIVVFAR